MDCTTARLMLALDRPNGTELDPRERRTLEDHLTSCPDCAPFARKERRLDERLGKAMRAVEVPDRLRQRLVARLESERAPRRLWRRYAAGGLAAAAAVLFAVAGWLVYQQLTLKPLNLDALTERVNDPSPSPEKVESAFRRQGVEVVAPPSLNYAFLADYGMGELQDEPVPRLLFIRNDETAKIYAEARVYIVSDRQFNLKGLPENYQSPSGYRYKVEASREPGSRFAYVIVHTGGNVDWLRRPDGAAE